MKQETNNEMDLLLRRLSRRGDSGMRDGETGEQHLDADELSSYAQNALPAPARARYMEHLADCASCRKAVTELSLALGAATAAVPAETVVAPSGLKAFLANLFSPMVLRYAVPALGVMVVMVIGFFVFQQQQRAKFVAQVDLAEKRSASEEIARERVTPASPNAANEQTTALPKAESEQSPVDQRSAPKREAVAGEGAAASGAAGAGAAPVTQSADKIAPSDTPPAAAAAEPPPAAPKAAVAELRKETDKEKKAEAQAGKQPETTGFVADAAKADANKTAAAPTAGRAESVPVQNRDVRSLGTLRPGTRAREEKREDKDAVETRSVAGRNFKKERGIWIDTAYDSSTRTVNLARGSEQFRALVADEPAINTIAGQLDGEVIVVWKGRAYHIR